MSYQVLARKWRPRTFKELVGQSYVLQALVNALEQDRLHHAYLFTGTRGVGKTTVARILAKCLNCEQGVSSTPCDQCSACCEINNGRFVDLIEVDAASRTKVEDTRELLENVQYAPTQGRYKVYLIDEVHMLSINSFNALLKTLEEPPPHVKFLLATTDPQKLPVTILSRCLQFSLKNMTPEKIVSHLHFILGEEKVPSDRAALWQLARAADGSMRDALSLTDQAIAFGNGKVSEEDVGTMLGTIDHGQVMKMVKALSTANVSHILKSVSSLAEYSPDYIAVLNDMLALLHRVAIAQAVPNAVDNSQGDSDEVIKLASLMTAEDVHLYYQIGLVGKRDLPLAPDPRSGFEMTLLRMLAFRPDGAPVNNEPLNISEVTSEVPSQQSDFNTTKETGVTYTEDNLLPSDKMDTIERSSLAVEETSQGKPAVEQIEPLVKPLSEEPAEVTGGGSVRESVLNNEAMEKTSSAALSTGLVEKLPSDPVESDILQRDYEQRVFEPQLSREAGHLPVVGDQEGEEGLRPPPNHTEETVLYDDQVVPGGGMFEESSSRDAGIVTMVESQETEQITTSVKSIVDLPEKADKIPFSALNETSWFEVFITLSLGGVTKTIGSHCEFVDKTSGGLTLRLDEGKNTLYNETHRQRIEKSICNYFDQTLNLSIITGSIVLETPAGRRERMIAEQLREAKENIHSDTRIKGLIETFSATLLEDSIRPLDVITN